jgi:hypothetical protein
VENGFDVSPETVRLIAEAFGISAENLRASPMRTRFSPSYRRFGQVYGAFIFIVSLIVILLDLHMRGRYFILDSFGTVMPLFVIFTLIFTVSGFSVKDGKLVIHFMGWTIKRDLAKLSGIEVNPQAFAGTFPIFAYCGCFGFVGYFYSSMLGGRYLGFITNDKNCVVLEFGKKKIVLAPDDPEAFIEAVREAAKGVCADGDSASSH